MPWGRAASSPRDTVDCLQRLEETMGPAPTARSLVLDAALHLYLGVWRTVYCTQHPFTKNSVKSQHPLCSKG